MIYTGIGSRSTPPDVLALMTTLAAELSSNGWTLRSGGAAGADAAFEAGASVLQREIYLPWAAFNGNLSALYTVTEEATRLSLKFHPTPERLSVGVKKLMGRNIYQVLGLDLNAPSDFLVFWTPSDGVGGTWQAIRIASHYNVPVFNLRDEGAADQVRNFASSVQEAR